MPFFVDYNSVARIHTRKQKQFIEEDGTTITFDQMFTLTKEQVLRRVPALRTEQMFLEALSNGQLLRSGYTYLGYHEAYARYDQSLKQLEFRLIFHTHAAMTPLSFEYAISPAGRRNKQMYHCQEVGTLASDTDAGYHALKATKMPHWKHYLTTVSEKRRLILAIHTPERLQVPSHRLRKNLDRIRKLLTLELVDVSSDTRSDQEIIAGIRELQKEDNIKRVQRLEECLGHEETKYEYAFKLLQQLYYILTSQLQIVQVLLRDPNEPESKIKMLVSESDVEYEIFQQVTQRSGVDGLFVRLLRAQETIEQMDGQKYRVVTYLHRLNGGDSEQRGILSLWINAIFDELDQKAYEFVCSRDDEGNPHMISMYIHSSAFVSFAKEKLEELQSSRKGRPISEKTLLAFVYLFRDWHFWRE